MGSVQVKVEWCAWSVVFNELLCWKALGLGTSWLFCLSGTQQVFPYLFLCCLLKKNDNYSVLMEQCFGSNFIIFFKWEISELQHISSLMFVSIL